MYAVRNATLQDMDFIMALAQREGWNPGLRDGESFFRADPKGFFIGELAGEPIGCICGVSYGAFGFIGLYIVEEEHRHKGYGIRLWERAMERLAGCNIGLDGVPAQQANYKKSGFRLAHRNLRFSGAITAQAPAAPFVVPAADILFPQIAAYDARHFPAYRSVFLSGWLDMPNARSLCWYENGAVRGYGTIRQCAAGYKIGPLFADAGEIAEAILDSLAGFAGESAVSMDIAETNENARALCKRLGMARQFETARMYTGEPPVYDQHGVYGITTFELG